MGHLAKFPLFLHHVLAVFDSYANRIFSLQSAFPKLQGASHYRGAQSTPTPAAPTSNPELCMFTECSGVASDSPNTCPAHPRCHVRACTPHFSSLSRSSYSSWQSCDTGFCKHSHRSSQEEYDLGAMCLHPSPAMRGGGWKNSTQGMDGFSVWGSAQS